MRVAFLLSFLVLFSTLIDNVDCDKRMYGGCPISQEVAPWLVFIRNCHTKKKYKTIQEMESDIAKGTTPHFDLSCDVQKDEVEDISDPKPKGSRA